MNHSLNIILLMIGFLIFPMSCCLGKDISYTVDPVTRHFQITYSVPADTPEEITVQCQWSPKGENNWKPARIMPFISETALGLIKKSDWIRWKEDGECTEIRAAGLKRRVVFDPYPEAQPSGHVDADFRITLKKSDGQILGTHQISLKADNSDVIYLEDWTKVFQEEAVSTDPKDAADKWIFRENQPDSENVTFGNGLYARVGVTSLPQLSYPLNLHGDYAIYACGDPKSGPIDIRLSGDEACKTLQENFPHMEDFWKYARMDNQHLVIRQCSSSKGYAASHIDYVKLVPISPELKKQIDFQSAGKKDKIFASYFEPYSWAFGAHVEETLKHKEPVIAYADAGTQLFCFQLGRLGSKSVYETRVGDQLIYAAEGDPTNGVVPKTDCVGRMQQYTNTLDAETRYGLELGMTPFANFGAGITYIGTPLESDIIHKHPDWANGNIFKNDVPGAQQYVLDLYREALDLGAVGISIDYCRYPSGVDSKEACNHFLRSLRKLANEYVAKRGKSVPILVRFPAKGADKWEKFDYETWIHENLVDYLCPSNIQGHWIFFDAKPYIKAAKGSSTKVLPVIDTLEWGPYFPSAYFQRALDLYQQGADGIYMYQAEYWVLNRTRDRRMCRYLSSTEALKKWMSHENNLTPYRSKRIYINPPEDGEVYHYYERIRAWVDGIPHPEVFLFLDGKQVNHYTKLPYTLLSEAQPLPIGKHLLQIRVKDGEGWLTKEFTVTGAD